MLFMHVQMPMLIVSWQDCSTSVRSFSAKSLAAFCSAPGSTMVNSSPPYLQANAFSGVDCLTMWAMSLSMLSPSTCPWVSLYFLKLSASIMMMLIGWLDEESRWSIAFAFAASSYLL